MGIVSDVAKRVKSSNDGDFHCFWHYFLGLPKNYISHYITIIDYIWLVVWNMNSIFPYIGNHPN